MVKRVHNNAGLRTALVLAGWLSFFTGLLVQVPELSIPLLAIARVLP